MDANRCSPASSDMRKTYSGAVTWLDLWVLPEDKQNGAERLVHFVMHYVKGPLWHSRVNISTHRTAVSLCRHSTAAPASCGLSGAGSSPDGRPAGKYQSWQLPRWWQCSGEGKERRLMFRTSNRFSAFNGFEINHRESYSLVWLDPHFKLTNSGVQSGSFGPVWKLSIKLNNNNKLSGVIACQLFVPA